MELIVSDGLTEGRLIKECLSIRLSSIFGLSWTCVVLKASNCLITPLTDDGSISVKSSQEESKVLGATGGGGRVMKVGSRRQYALCKVMWTEWLCHDNHSVHITCEESGHPPSSQA